MDAEINQYIHSLTSDEQAICNSLFAELKKHLTDATYKLWHGSPVWFINENPVAGFSARKDSVQLLFWSGQSFEEAGLSPEGSFKAAEKRYVSKDEINIKDLKRWLKKAKTIQWDYKNIVKRKGALVLLEAGQPAKSAAKQKLKNGAKCRVIAGTHKGKTGRVEDMHTSKTGAVTITVLPASGVRFKTLAKNVEVA
jgi:hypothetical protein